MKFEPKQSDKIATHRKEQHFKESYTLFEIKDNKPKEVIELRIYQTANTSYAVVWIRNGDTATGVGKDLYRNDASQHALYNAGFSGLPSDPSPRVQLCEIANFLQLKNHYIHHAHA